MQVRKGFGSVGHITRESTVGKEVKRDCMYLQKGEYRYIPDMVEDFNLMFDNAQQYNRPDSRIYRDAVKLQKYVQNKAEEIMSMDDEVGGGGIPIHIFFST